jgi:hypothetical protein
MRDADKETREARLNSRLESRPNAPHQKNGKSDVALVPSGQPLLPVWTAVFKKPILVFLTVHLDKPTYRPDDP